MGKILAIAVVLTALVGGSVANAAEEAPQEPRVMSERCEAWLAYMVWTATGRSPYGRALSAAACGTRSPCIA